MLVRYICRDKNGYKHLIIDTLSEDRKEEKILSKKKAAELLATI